MGAHATCWKPGTELCNQAFRGTGPLRYHFPILSGGGTHKSLTHIPALDDTACPDGEGKRLAPVAGGVELFPALHGSRVVRRHLVLRGRGPSLVIPSLEDLDEGERAKDRRGGWRPGERPVTLK